VPLKAAQLFPEFPRQTGRTLRPVLEEPVKQPVIRVIFPGNSRLLTGSGINDLDLNDCVGQCGFIGLMQQHKPLGVFFRMMQDNLFLIGLFDYKGIFCDRNVQNEKGFG
jgi:hypothetical protein